MLTAPDSNPTHKKHLANEGNLYQEQYSIHNHGHKKEY